MLPKWQPVKADQMMIPHAPDRRPSSSKLLLANKASAAASLRHTGPIFCCRSDDWTKLLQGIDLRSISVVECWAWEAMISRRAFIYFPRPKAYIYLTLHWNENRGREGSASTFHDQGEAG